MSSKKNPNNIAENLLSMLPRVEVMVIGILLLSFFVWAASKCSSSSKEFPTREAQQLAEEAEMLADSIDKEQKPTLPVLSPPLETTTATTTVTNTNAAPPPPRSNYQTLYATLADAKVRKAPHLDSLVVDKLSLFEAVSYLNQRTDFRQKINIGTEYAYEPWIYIQTKRGKRGWVYGAALHYDKWDRLKERTVMPE